MAQPTLRILDDDELTAIHAGSLEVLERIGMRIEHTGARELLAGAGAKVDATTGVVRFPSVLVEEKLALVPRTLDYHGRSPAFDFTLAPDGPIYSRIAGGAPRYVELATGRQRPARTDDLREFSTLSDALPEIHVASVLQCEDVPPETSDLRALAILLAHQRKAIATNALSLANLRALLEMLEVVRGSREAVVARPPVHLLLCPVSPLTILDDVAAQLLLCCEYGIPTDNPIMPVAGATAPITLAGTLVQANAEFLGLMTLAQTARPGHSMPYFADPVVADMRTGNAQFATPETGLLIAAVQQLGASYGFPPQGIGLDSDGFDYAQSLFQKAQNALFQVMSGGRLLIGAGNVEGCMAFDPAQLVIDDEIVRIARRWARGIRVDSDAIALDVIERVGPGGQFLDDDHTLAGLRAGELIGAELFARGGRETWLAAGGRDVVVRARDKARSILDAHEVEPLPDDVSRELERIVAAADRQAARAVGAGVS